MRRRSILAPALILLAAFGAEPLRAEDAGAWTSIKATEGPQKALVDCRSLTLRHDRRVPAGQPWQHAGAEITCERLPDEAWSLTWTHPEHAPKARRITPRKLGPQSVTLKGLGALGALSVGPDPVGTGLLVASVHGVEFRVGTYKAYLVDSDMDGVLGSEGDGLVAPLTGTVGPWRAEIYTPATGIRVRRTEDGAWEQSLLPVPYPQNRDHTAAWRLLQWKRQQCGVLPVGYKAELEHGIKLHGDYCIENHYQGHVQDPKGKAYSQEGAVAGMQCVLGYGVTTLVEGMGQQFGTLYHRSGLLQPALTHTALAVHRGVFGGNVRDSAAGPLAGCILLYPAHGMQDVERQFYVGGENPMPVKGRLAGIQNLGTSVGLYAGPLEQTSSMATKPKLSVTQLLGAKRKRGSSFRLDLYYPGRLPNDGVHASNFGNVALTPPRPLEKKTTYQCRILTPLPSGVTVPLGKTPDVFEFVWEFTTGR